MRYNDIRRKTRSVAVGNLRIGARAPIAIQSMTNTSTENAERTLEQVRKLERAGCDVVRLSIPTEEAAYTVWKLKEAGIKMPIVADIHFDYRVALRCAELGFDKIRINPGNIGDEDRIKAVCDACRERRIPIRIGVNAGSLEAHILKKYGSPTPEELCESALYHVSLLEKFGFYDTVISIKASNVKDMIDANRLLASKCDYPLHLGVTEAGGGERGLLKSTAGIGALLCDGIGDTIRVSLTDDPVQEIGAARKILQAVGVEGQSGMDIISCPTCARTQIDLIPLVKRFEAAVAAEGLDAVPLKVALMGCVVNGPGEAREADIGIAGGIGEGLLFSHGEILHKVPEDKIIEVLIDKIKEIKNQR